jgi:hypothetical protein
MRSGQTSHQRQANRTYLTATGHPQTQTTNAEPRSRFRGSRFGCPSW